MTTLETVRPTPALEALIDARLDTIDRMLLDVLPRQDRLAILRDVESQIHEQLQARAADELSRADVLAVLAALDPPEAYLPEHSDDAAPRPARTVRMSRAVATTPLEPGLRSAASSERGRSSALLGILTLIASIFLPIFCFMLALFAESAPVYFAGAFVSTMLVLIAGTLATVYSARAGMGNRWSVAGFITGLASVILILVGDIVGLLCIG